MINLRETSLRMKVIVAQCSHHGLSYFHFNDVFIDVIAIVLTRHTVVDVILTQVMLTGENHTIMMSQCIKTQPELKGRIY